MAAKDYKVFDGTAWVSPCDQEIRILMPDGVTWKLLDPTNEDVKYFDGAAWKPMLCIDPPPPAIPINCTQGSLSGSGSAGIYYIPMTIEANVCDVAITLDVASVPDSLAILSADKSTVLIQTGYFGSGANPTPGPYNYGLFKPRKIYTYDPTTPSNFSINPLAPNETLTVLSNQFPITDTNPLNIPNAKNPADQFQTVRTITWTKGVTPTDVNILIRVVGHPDSGTVWTISAIACANCPPPPPTCTPSCGAWVYTYTAWSAWSTCVSSSQTRTRTANGTRTCILADCSTTVETSSNIETETQSCTLPVPPSCTPSCPAWTYTYTTWSAWSTCVNGSQIRTRTVNGSRTCIIANCSTNIETSSTTETETQSCTPPVPSPCTDCVDTIVPIADQTWAGCNATVSKYRDNTIIPFVDNASVWSSLTTGAWCYPNGQSTKEGAYGKLYNWYAIAGIHDAASLYDPSLRKEFAPAGWHVPLHSELLTLLSSAGVGNQAYSNLKKIGTCNWYQNSDATDLFGFKGVAAGFRNTDGSYNQMLYHNYLWSKTETGTNLVYAPDLCYTASCGGSGYIYQKTQGLSVRLLQNNPTCTIVSPTDVQIGSQYWTNTNAKISTYRDGTVIPQVGKPADWSTLTTGAWCWYDNDAHYDNGQPTDDTHGKLYNWYAIAGIHDAASLANPALRKEFAPVNYHVPTEAEWTILENTLGGHLVAGSPLKQTGFCRWASPNTGATNTTGFTAIASGQRGSGTSGYRYINKLASYWTSTQSPYDVAYAYFKALSANDTRVYTNFIPLNEGCAVRFIKN